jgi:hypothetical protein
MKRVGVRFGMVKPAVSGKHMSLGVRFGETCIIRQVWRREWTCGLFSIPRCYVVAVCLVFGSIRWDVVGGGPKSVMTGWTWKTEIKTEIVDLGLPWWKSRSGTSSLKSKWTKPKPNLVLGLNGFSCSASASTTRTLLTPLGRTNATLIQFDILFGTDVSSTIEASSGQMSTKGGSTVFVTTGTCRTGENICMYACSGGEGASQT